MHASATYDNDSACAASTAELSDMSSVAMHHASIIATATIIMYRLVTGSEFHMHGWRRW